MAYKLDYDKLGKGDVISVERIEEMTETKRGTDSYGLAAMCMANEVKRELANRGHPVTITQEKGAIVICTDDKASGVTKFRFAKGIKGAGRALADRQAIDVGKLSSDLRLAHDRDSVVMANMYQAALIDGSASILAVCHQRKTPGLPGKDNGK